MDTAGVEINYNKNDTLQTLVNVSYLPTQQQRSEYNLVNA